MFQVFEEEKWVSLAMVITLAAGILGRIIIWILYQNMIKETDNMSATNNKVLKQCKLKFANCYQLNGGVANVPIFVEKFINRLAIGPMTFEGYYHLSGQLVLLSVLFSGIGVCRSIIGGRSLGDILPFYIFSFGSLYVYFSVSALTDIKGQKRVLKTNLVDYLENHMTSKLINVEKDLEIVNPGGKPVSAFPVGQGRKRGAEGVGGSFEKREVLTSGLESSMSDKVTTAAFSKAQEQELEELLREFLKNA